jgi:hypothetical protein
MVIAGDEVTSLKLPLGHAMDVEIICLHNIFFSQCAYDVFFSRLLLAGDEVTSLKLPLGHAMDVEIICLHNIFLSMCL